ncbi:MAG: type IV pilus twitching motility protein PilT [Planctomycetota bacterium]|jgi:hypothetical protein
MIQIDRILAAAVRQQAEDIIFTVGRPPVFRVNGELEALETETLTPDDTLALMKSITPERYQQELQEEGSSDFGFSFGENARFRVGVFRQQGKVCVALRLIPTKIRSFQELALGPAVQELLFRPRGLILVTGPTGSGKTTTLATMIDQINRTRKVHILTIEDPIEYRQPHKKAIVSQREVGVDVPSFSEALHRAVREAPDVILVGEMRDLRPVPRQRAAPDPHTAGQLPAGGAGPDPGAPHRRRTGGGLRDTADHRRHPTPDPRQQDLPHRLRHSDRPGPRNAAARRPPAGALPPEDDRADRRADPLPLSRGGGQGHKVDG